MVLDIVECHASEWKEDEHFRSDEGLIALFERVGEGFVVRLCMSELFVIPYNPFSRSAILISLINMPERYLVLRRMSSAQTDFKTWLTACNTPAALTLSTSFPNPPLFIPSASPSIFVTYKSLYEFRISRVAVNVAEGEGWAD